MQIILNPNEKLESAKTNIEYGAGVGLLQQILSFSFCELAINYFSQTCYGLFL